MERREIRFAGHVQGVGFRYATATAARSFAVDGFVRNLPDGRVELVVEGEPEEINRFVAAVADRMKENIREQTSRVAPATGEFDSFDIRFG